VRGPQIDLKFRIGRGRIDAGAPEAINFSGKSSSCFLEDQLSSRQSYVSQNPDFDFKLGAM
jgi:hypothetical protein